MNRFTITIILVCFLVIVTSNAQLFPEKVILNIRYQTGNQTPFPVLVIPFIQYPGYEYVYAIKGSSDSLGYIYKRFLPIENRTSESPLVQDVLDIAINNLSDEGVAEDTIILYQVNPDQLFTTDEMNFTRVDEVTLIRVIQGVPSEKENIGFFYRLDPENTIIEREYSNVTLTPFENVTLESPYDVLNYQMPEVAAIPFTRDQVPLIVTSINLGYTFNERPYYRGNYYEPIWIFRGLNRRGEDTTVMTWASKERGMDPPHSDLDTAIVSYIIVHNASKTHVLVYPGDPGFDRLEAEAKQVLATLHAECPCAISPEKRVDQRENGSYVEVVFRDGANTLITLDETRGPYGIIEQRLDGAIIAFQGPYGRQVYALYRNEECNNCTVWAFHLTWRDTSILEAIANEITG